MDYPLVSCIALAGQHPLPHVLAAIKCFREQTYPNKELIIVNNCHTQWQAAGLNIQAESNIFILDTPQYLSAGMARNYGISAANGQILAQFDINHWHHRKRLEAQIGTMANASANICVLSRVIQYSGYSSTITYSTNDKSAILNSMIFVRPRSIDYPDWQKNEEFGILSRLQASGLRIVSMDKPDLMCKLVLHGDNRVDSIRTTKAHAKAVSKALQAMPRDYTI